MDLDQLKKILDLVREHGLSEFEVEEQGLGAGRRPRGFQRYPP